MKLLAFLLLIAFFWIIQTFVVMLLWNGIIASLFPVPQADFWFAAGVSMVLAIVGSLFRGVRSKV